MENAVANGCFHNRETNQETEELIEDMTKVRPEMLSKEALKLYNTIMRILDERDNLIKERDYYKARYLEFNKGVLEGMKIIKERDEINNK